MTPTDRQDRRARRTPPLSCAEIERIASRLAVLGHGTGATRMRIGEGLLRLDAVGGVKALGFPNLEAYCRESLGRSGRFGSDVRALARRLSDLPQLRAALITGRLNASMVELVARVATPLDEGEWVERAATMNVRAMRAELMRRRLEVMDDDAPERTTIALTVPRDGAWAFERAKLMVEAVGGVRGDEAVEAMLAEGLTEILARIPDLDLPWNLTADAQDEVDESRRVRAERRAERETQESIEEGAAQFVGAAHHVAVGSGAESEVAWPATLNGIDQRLRALAHELASRDMELATLGRLADEHAIWWHLGYASFDHYCRDGLGVAPSVMASRVALARRLGDLPEIARAVTGGLIGYEAASAIARVAGPVTVDLWIERAEGRTVKTLREEVAATEMMARVEGIALRSALPPDRETMGEVHDLERSVLASLTDGSLMSVGSRGEVCEVPELPRSALRLSLSEDTGRFWRALEAVHTRLVRGAESFVAFLVRATARSWSGVMARDVAYGDIYLRDRWRCASPVCSRRHVTPHHIRFRSHGGSDTPDNIVALCEICHLELVHEGRLRVTGVAPDGLRWAAMGWAA